jgi:N-acetylmuramoyl-L-alanine amidase
MKRSIKTSKLVLLSAFLFVPLLSFSQGNFIRLVDTDGDTARIQGLKLRYSGSTLPGSVLKINNTPVKVYPSGAFAAFLENKPGLNKVDLVSENPEHGIASKTIWVECNVPVSEKTTTGFAIDYVRLIPDQDQCVVTGDVVNVKVKAQHGNIVRVKGKRLFELPDSVTGGVAGIYQGQYIISADDTFKLAGVEAEMTNSEGEKTTATSKSLLSINSREFNRFGLTTGKMPALYMGLGTDRLDGAKFGYLDTAVVVMVTGRTGDMDRVRLADGKNAWMNKTNIALLPEGYILPVPVLSSSFMISGNDDFDFVKMYIPQRVPYTSSLEINPDRIELDIYGVASNTNWITQLNSAKEVKNVYYRQLSHDVLRVIIELNHKQAWGYSVYYENRYLVVRVKHQPEKLKLSDLTIALDAGHGGSSDGAWGSTGLLEKDVNLQIVEKIKKALEKRGAKVILTRSDDSGIYTTDRWLSLVPKNPDIMLSIHNNSIGNSDPLASKGVSTYYKYIGFRPLSVCMYNELLKCGLSENGNTGSFNFTLNSPTEFVNALIEVAFMSNPEDEMKLMDDRFLNRIADHVVAGLDDFLREAGK